MSLVVKITLKTQLLGTLNVTFWAHLHLAQSLQIYQHLSDKSFK